MDDVGSLEFQLNKLQLSEVTSTDEVIGRGAFGRVIKVHVHGTLCAAKEIHPLLVESASPQEFETIRKSFYKECVNANQIHHPNVVQMLGIYYPTPQAKLPWLVMEMMEMSLKSFVEKHTQGKVPLHFKLSILVNIAQGLEFLHGQDIIHRDLSSNNVLLTKHLVAKIADLGVAKMIQENKMKTHTQAPGTTHFMPPEALKNRPHYGKPVDVFSLACVTLHVMSHQWPEPKDRVSEDTMTALTEMQRRDEYATFCTQPALKELVEFCLHNRPERRPEISFVCTKFKELKVTVEQQVPFTTHNNYQLFAEVRQVNVQNKKLKDTIVQLEASIATVHKQIKEKDLLLEEKDQQIQEKDQQLQEKDQKIREKDQEIQAKDQQIEEIHKHKFSKECVSGHLEEMVNFGNNQPPLECSYEPWMVTQHIDPSSHIDDDDNQLVKDSTNLGYRNPPEAKFQCPIWAIPSSLQPVPLTKHPTPEGLQLPPITDSKFGKTNLHYLKNKKPIAAPRSTTSANFAGSNTHSSSSTFSSRNTYKLWQCAHCKMVNEANNSCCETCKLPRGKMADRSYFCEFCQLLMYIPLRKETVDTSCPRCKTVYESAF